MVPIAGAEDSIECLDPSTTITVTCSPRRLEPTIDLAERLQRRGYRVVPHLAARLITSKHHLVNVLERAIAAGIRDVFIVGGDAAAPLGPYPCARSLLDGAAESGLAQSFEAIGIAGYPEGHPTISHDDLLKALHEKQPMATYLVTQVCFSPDRILRWIAGIRVGGIHLPTYLGLPGPVQSRKLLDVSLRIGVGNSVRFLRKNTWPISRLIRGGALAPATVLNELRPHLSEPAVGIDAIHFFAFNQVSRTKEWRDQAVGAETWR